MTPNYTYINSPNYINSFDFDYVETWSFQRGDEYEQNLKQLTIEYGRLKARRTHDKNLTADEETNYKELHRLLGFTQYLIDDQGRFHRSGKKITTLRYDNPVIERLKQILQTEVLEVPMSLCAPVYRDALVFYDRNGNIVSVLNVCLSCQYMETEMFAHIKGDYKTYDLLKKFFLEIGHEVEKPEYSILEEMEKLKHKYGKQ